MNKFEGNLKGFERRVRLVRSWRGFTVGAAAGAAAALALAIADYLGWAYTEWPTLLGALGIGAVAGAGIGLFGRVTRAALADSIDRRGKLKNRLGTAMEAHDETSFAGAQAQDAMTHLQDLRPATLYPIRVSKLHAGVLALTALAAMVFILGNSSVFLSDEGKRDREEMEKAAAAIERVAKPLREEKPFGKKPEEKELARRLEEFKKELEKGRIPKQEAMQKANELLKKAEELEKKRFEKAEESLQTAEEALQKMALKQMQEKGMPIDQLENAKLNLSPQEQALQQQQMNSLEQQIKQLEQKLRDGKGKMSDSEKKALEQQLGDAKKQLQELKLSKEAQEVFKKLMEQPEMREIMEMMKKLQQNAQAGKQGDQKQLTQEEIEEMQRKLEELAKRLKDPEEMKKFLEELKKSLEECKGGGQCAGLSVGLAGVCGMPVLGNGKGGRSQDNFFANTGKINKSDKESDINAKSLPMAVRGDRQAKGEETYIEIKGPTGVGSKSSTPYIKVLPRYKKQAEEAIDRQKIPRNHQKRVKDYFDSLAGGK